MRGEIQTGQKSAQIECSGVVSGAEANVRSPGKNKIERTSHPGLIRRVHMPATPWLGWALYIYMHYWGYLVETRIEQQAGKICSQLPIIGTFKDFSRNWRGFELLELRRNDRKNEKKKVLRYFFLFDFREVEGKLNYTILNYCIT